jgi:hypothetical protein
MTKVDVDQATALATFRKAAKDAVRPDYMQQSAHADALEHVITGSHLTYRYMLVTALLAKATNEAINPLAVQAKADIENAFDARSLCHSVIVPNEASLLKSALGGSNEPYLNKPARIPYLSESNPVRGGRDRETLKLLCRILPNIKTRDEASKALSDALFFAIRAAALREKEVETAVAGVKTAPAQVRAFLKALLEETHHGETVVLVSALLYWLLSRHKGEEWSIQVHPVNEAGSSSNQISDIDVYSSAKNLVHTCEVKDKEVIASDVHHAIRKAATAHCKALHIILGLSGRMKGTTPAALEAFAANLGMELSLFSISSLVEASAFWTPASVSFKDIVERTLEFAEIARMKQATRDFILKTIITFTGQ